MRLLLFLSVLASGCTAHRYECERHGGRPSVRIGSEHFTVTSDLPEDEARVEVRRLERLWDAYSVFFKRVALRRGCGGRARAGDLVVRGGVHAGSSALVPARAEARAPRPAGAGQPVTRARPPRTVVYLYTG